jgi:acyl carrier protein
MGNDIVHMREKIAKLEQEKTFLRQDLEGQDKAAQALVDEAELDSLDRVDLIRRHVKLCQRFGSEVKRSREYSQRVQKLQNEIIKKNDQEKGLLKIQQAHTAQQALVQKLQEHLERSRKYKETCRQQEKVINKLEELIAKHVHDSTLGQTTDTADVVDLLRKENSQLRASLLKFEDAKASGNEVEIGALARTMVKAPEVMILQQQLQEEKQRCEKLVKEMEQLKVGQGLSGGFDKWDVEQKLHRSEGRVQSLEETLTTNAKSWAREKAALEVWCVCVCVCDFCLYNCYIAPTE